MTTPPRPSPRRKHLVLVGHTESGRPVYVCHERKRWVAAPEDPKGHVLHDNDHDPSLTIAEVVRAREHGGHKAREVQGEMSTTTTLEPITLGPGCLGRDVHLMTSADPTYNRPVERSTVVQYKRAMDDIERVGNLIALWRTPSGKLKILDGQHRITAVSEGQQSRRFLAVIYPSGAPVQAMAEALHKQRAHSVQQNLYITQGRSAWPDAMRGDDLPYVLTYTRSDKRRVVPVRWKALISTVASAEDCVARQTPTPRWKAPKKGALSVWLAPLETLTTTPAFWRAFLRWWCTGVRSAPKKRWVPLLSPRTLHAAALLRWCNQDASAAILDRARDRVLEASPDGLAELRLHMASGSRLVAERFVRQFMHLANLRTSANRLGVFGCDGSAEVG